MTTEIESLNVDCLVSKRLDAPNDLLVSFKDTDNLEKYVRLASLPGDIKQLVTGIIEAENVKNLIKKELSYLPAPTIGYNLNGTIQLYFTLETGDIFSIILINYNKKSSIKNGMLTHATTGSIRWSFNSRKFAPQKGECDTVEDLIKFMKESLTLSD